MFVSIVAAEILLFSIAATRGLDLTDESFYLLSFRHWAEVPTASFFGAYWSLPYKLVGQSLWAIRVLGFLVLLGSGVWFTLELNTTFDCLAARTTRHGAVLATLAGGTGIWSYYGAAFGPYTPSYNLLTLACAMVTLALALRIGRALSRQGGSAVVAETVALGVAASICIATKFSAGALMLCLDALVIALLGWRRVDMRTGIRVALGIAAGLLLNVAVLAAIDPDAATRLRRGLAIGLTLLPRDPVAELLAFARVELPRGLAEAPRILMWPTVSLAVACGLATRLDRHSSLRAIALLAFVVGALRVIYLKENHGHRFSLLTSFAVLVLLASAWMMRKSDARLGARGYLLALVVLCMPFAYAIGTGNALLRHMGMAGIFPIALAISRIRALREDGLLATWAFASALIVAAALPAEIVVRQWLDGSYTYRLGVPLRDQGTRAPPNGVGIDVRIDDRVATGLAGFLKVADDAGLEPGTPMIDFTGQSPGLVAIRDGDPLGAIWLIGGPIFQGNQSARLALSYVEPARARRAWLLTSADSFARIDAWRNIMESKLGGFYHEAVGTFSMPDPTSDDKTKTIEVTLWRPQR